MKKLFFLGIITFFAACSVKLATPIQADVDRVSTKYPGYSLADLNEGKSLFEHNCNRCHHLKNPASRSEDKWEKIVPKMMAKLNKKEGHPVLTDKEQESILRYLITMRTASKSGT